MKHIYVWKYTIEKWGYNTSDFVQFLHLIHFV